MRSTLRSLLVCVLLVVSASALFAAVAFASEGSSGSSAPDASGSPLGGPLVGSSVDQLLLGEGARAARRARRSDPAAIAQRSAARSRFEGLSPAGAAGEAKSAFPGLIEQTAGGTPTLGSGQRILRYATNHAAEVLLADGAKGVLESTAPIATTSGHRHLPLDLHLTEAGGAFKPVRSSVAVDFPKDASEGASLVDLGVSLTPVDRHGSPLAGSQGALDGASVLWRHSDRNGDAQDLESVAKATSTGLELTTMLLSERSPGELYFHVGMPSGAHLQGQGNGSAQILQGKRTLATIAPVSAEDAEGTNVPVQMSVHGHTLSISLALDGDYLYPIAVDPEINDSQLAKTPAGRPSNWKFSASSGHFEKKETAGEPGVLETKGVSEYNPGEVAYWAYQTQGVSHIYEIKVIDSAHNKGHKVESFLEFVGPGGTKETERKLSNETLNPEYENKTEAAFCSDNPLKEEELDPPTCGPTFGKANNIFHFEQAATAKPGASYGFSDSMTQGIVSIAEPSGTHSTTSYNTTSPTIEVEVEAIGGGKEKVKRTNALYGSGSWLSRLAGTAGGAIQLKAADTGIGVSQTKLEYLNSGGGWTPLEEHNYLNENGCKGVQCFVEHAEGWTMEKGALLPDGEDKLRYKAQEAISGTESLSSEGKTTVKVDTKKPHNLEIEGLPYGNELSERSYELSVLATDGESSVASSGIKSIELIVDKGKIGAAEGSCTVGIGTCTASIKRTVNGAELGAGKHNIEIIAIDNAGNEAKALEHLTIRHSTPVALGPGSVDLESGDFALGASDVSMGSGLTVGRNYSSRNPTAGGNGPFGPEWNLSMGNTESLEELFTGDVLLTAANGKQTMFAALGAGKFESPTGDSNLELTLEENEAKEKLAYYLKNPAAHTSVKFTRPAGTKQWVPSVQEGAVSTDTVTYSYETAPQYTVYPVTGSTSSIRGIAAGGDGNEWFTDPGANKVSKVTPTGAVTSYSLPAGSEPQQIVGGPDGNVWYTQKAHKVAKITPSGQITEYPTKFSENSTSGITVGPDGQIWFVEASKTISEINPATGVRTTKATPHEAQELALGPDGNVWVAEFFAGKIAKVTSGGGVTEYTLPAESKPLDITAGSDKESMWFTNQGTNKIGKITLSGTVTEYSLPEGPWGKPKYLTTGPDGNVWFTPEGQGIGKVTPSGEVSVYPVYPGPVQIAPGPGGNLWYTGWLASSGTYSVGSISPPGLIARPTEVRAPVQPGVSCSWTKKPTEMNPGCRALELSYGGTTYAVGEAASQWSIFEDRLDTVSLVAYDPVAKEMRETTVAQYLYDQRGRLREVYDPRISPALKTTYGYDENGDLTALSPPGQEPWTFTYGAVSGDAGTGRLLKAARAPASATLWNGETLANTEAPKITGAATEKVRLTASTGSWSNGPITYGYQWSRCASANSCSPIPGASNANYTPQAADVGDTLRVSVTATNGGGSLAANSAETAVVKTLAGNVSEYSLPASSGARAITPGPEAGTLWFTDFTSSKFGKVTSSGTITEWALPASSGPEAIVKGSDGNLWLANYTSNKVAKVISSGPEYGNITEYALGAGSKPKSIAAGSDGNLWVANYSTSKIAKVTTAGAVTEYALPTNTKPTSITAGPDGNLWYTAYEKYKIGKITTSGTITEYALTAGIRPRDIVTGPDGNLWFTEQSSEKVGKITTSGTISEYTLSTAPETPEYIASAAGSLWVTSKGSNALYRVSTSGAVTSYALPEGSQPQKMAVNSLGDIWFAEFNDKLAKFSPSAVSEGEVKSPEPGTTLNYNVPITGANAPHNMSEAEVAKWGQSDLPVEATAITAPDEPQGWPASSYKRAVVHYLDEQGREVNIAAPSNATYGSISTTEYNEFNDVIRTLTPSNRATALAAGASSVEKAKLLDTQSTFNGEGAKEGEVAEPGTMLVESFGPQHMIKYHAGGEGSGEIKERLGRGHKKFVYDQGAPGGETYHLLTEEKDLAYLDNSEDVEVRTTKKAYSGQSNLGWKLRAPTSVTVDPTGTHEGSLNLTSTTEYNSTTGQVTEVRGAGAEKTFSYASKFGETGTEAGKLKAPWGVAVNSEGKLWVVDSANNRVEQFSSSGSYLAKFGEAGSGNGQFNAPTGIALDGAGHIWVADTANNRIQEFSSTGTFMATVGSLGTEPGKFKAPTALAFDSKGNMWVADTGNSRIEKFDKEAKYVSEFGSAGTEPGKLKEPKGIAVDAGEHVWVADTANNRIQEFSTTGTLLKRFGTAGAGEGQLNTPIDLKIDSSGNIWTVDSANNRAESFSPSGAYLTQIGWKGTEAGQLTEPRSLAFDATGKAWVTDSSNNRLEQWSKGPNAHDSKTVYYSAAANGEYPTCGSHPEWAGLACETLPAKQPELMGLPKLPVTVTTYNMYNEPETITETFGSTTRTKKESYDSAGRKSTSEVTASTGTALPKVKFTYNSELGSLEKQSTEGAEEKTLSSEFNRLGQTVKYTDSDGNVAKYKYAGPEGDLLLEEVSDSSASGTSKQTYEYDSTTKLRTKLVDSAAGSFTASYDAEGRLTSVSYPYSLCANYAYNAVGEATSVSYIKSSNCSETEAGTYYSDSKMSSVRGELISQSSTLASETYAYDDIGRLTETQETPAGEGCTVRAYAYDEEGNRASSASRSPGVGGACQSEGGTIEAHNYDEANRLADGGMAYDGLGNVTKLPAADAEGKELTSTFYVDNAVASQTQGGVTNEYKLDPEGRVRETTTGATKTKSHYDGPGEAVAWTENAEQWVRNIPGIDGALLATQTNGATPVLQLHDLQGNVVGTIGDKAGETKLLSSYNSTEFGVPNAGKAPPKFAWLGAAGVESSFSTGVITYGSTSYVPQTARALQSEAVEAPGQGGGSGLGAPYELQESPWGWQAAAARGAQAPGLEAAREREAFEASLIDPWVHHTMNRSKAESRAEEFFEAESVAVVLEMFDLPGDLLELAGKIAGEVVSEFDNAYKWMYDAGTKLRKCANNKRKLNGRDLNICWFEYEQEEWEPEFPPWTGIHPIGKVTFPNFSVEPIVNECIYITGPSLVCVAPVHIKTEL